MSTSDITSVFTEGVGLGSRAIRNRTHFKKKYNMFLLEKAVHEGKLRRVNPGEVGSNRYNRPADSKGHFDGTFNPVAPRGRLPFSRVIETQIPADPKSKKKATVIYHSHFTRVRTRSTEGKKEASTKRKYFHKSRMNVFMLV
jgi:hypothetical protein